MYHSFTINLLPKTSTRVRIRRSLAVLGVLGLLLQSSFGIVSPALATGGGPNLTTCTLYGYHDADLEDSQFFKMNLQTGAVTNIGSIAENEDLEAIDTHPATGVMYGFPDQGSDDTSSKLVTINHETGARTFVANVSTDFELPGASFNPVTNELWASADTNDNLYTINLATGAPTLKLDASKSGEPQGLAWNNAGTVLYVAYDDTVYTTNGTSALVEYATVDDEIEAMEFDENNNLLVGMHGDNNLYVLSGGNLIDTGKNFGSDVETLTTRCPVAPATGSVKVDKKVDADGDGQFEGGNTAATNLGFRWGVDAGAVTRTFGTTATELVPANHTVTENAITDFHFAGWYPTGSTQYSCTNPLGTTLPVSVTITAGETSTITLCNAKDETPVGRILVRKNVDTDGDGDVDQQNANGWTWDAVNGAAQTVVDNAPMGNQSREVTPANYVVKENQQTGYHVVSAVCNGTNHGAVEQVNVTVANGQTVECTFTNARDTGTVIVNKQFDDNGDGQIDRTNPESWSWDIVQGEQNIAGGHSRVLPTGATTVREDAVANYRATWSCSDDRDGEGTSIDLTVKKGETITCTFVNTRHIGSIKIYKQLDENGDGTFEQDHARANELGFRWGLDGANPTRLMGSTATGVLSGSHTVTENMITGFHFVGWYLSTDERTCDSPRGTELPITVTVLPQKTTEIVLCNAKTVVPMGALEGTKFNDLDGDGVKDAGEPGIQGVTIHLGELSDVTDATGHYSFTNLTVGTYTVSETVPTGWMATTPNPVTNVAVVANQTTTVNFGNFKLGSIAGMKFNDLDRDGTKDGNEPGLANWTIFIDANGNGVKDQAEVSTLTNGNGAYSFTGLHAGTYRVREVQQAGWTQTTANPADVVVQSGTTATNVNFGNSLDQLDLTVTKTDGLTTALPGQTIVYTMVVTNNGNQTAQNVTATDTLPAQVTFVSSTIDAVASLPTITLNTAGDQLVWNLGTMTPGSSKTIQATVTLDAVFPIGTTTLTNVIVVATSSTETNTENNQASDETRVTAAPVISLTKTDAPDPVNAGQNITYTLTWSVSGNAEVTNLTLTDPLPLNTTFVSASNGGVLNGSTVTWNLGTKVPGNTGSLTLVVKVASPIANGTIITNVATLDSTETDPVVATATTPVVSAPILSISKTVNITTFANPGQTVTYTIVVTNAANATDTAHNVIVTDTLPAGFTFEDATTTKSFPAFELAPGTSKTITVNAIIGAGVVAGTYTNVAVAKSSNHPDVTASVPVEVRLPQILTSEPELTIVKTISKPLVNAGDTVTYTIAVKNVGSTTAINVIVTDTMLKGFTFVNGGGTTHVFKLGDIEPGKTVTFPYDVKVGNAVKPGTYENIAVADADNADSVSDTANVTIRPVAVLAETGASTLDLALFVAGAGFLSAGFVLMRRQRRGSFLMEL